MTDDRELLELAAKAAGVERAEDRFDCGISVTDADGRHRSLWRWNPLENDGDALRLAVKVGINVVPCCGSALANGLRESRESYSDHEGDEMAATRRAIVRAAAEIGRAM